nr:immunoglobulin light chain junction region [Mus musculus]
CSQSTHVPPLTF